MARLSGDLIAVKTSLQCLMQLQSKPQQQGAHDLLVATEAFVRELGTPSDALEKKFHEAMIETLNRYSGILERLLARQ